MRTILILGCIFALAAVGCAPAAAATPAAPTESPKAVPTPTVDTLENPPPCWGADLIYHSRLKQMLLVNCIADPSKASLLTIWGWDGTRWHRVTEGGPAGRILGGAAYDQLRNALVLYGGRPVELGMCSQETWEWDGEFWEQKNASPPTACDHVRMVYDAHNHASILFSGLDPSENPVNETWSWNGKKWKLLSQQGPESRGHFGLVYDPTHEQILMYGGYAHSVTDGFWAWKDDAWQQIDFPGPGKLSHFGMAYDTDANALYTFGGATSGSTFSSLTNKTWVLNEGRWRELTLSVSPSKRGSPTMGYDPSRKRLVLYGGFDSSGEDFADTWEWDGKAWRCLINCE